MLSRAQIKNQLVPGLAAILQEGYKAFEKKDHLAIYGSSRTSKKAYEEALMNAELGVAQEKAEGQGMFLDDGMGEMWKARVDMKTFALRFTITKEAIADNQYMNPSKALTRSMARGHAERLQIEGHFPLNNATSTSYLGGDGKALAVTDHPTKDGGVNSNLVTAADFNEASYEEMLLQPQAWVDQRGIKLSPKVKKVLLPTGYTFLAQRLAKSTGRIGGNDNDANVHQGFDYHISQYFTDTDAWFGVTDVQDGMVFYMRQELKEMSEVNFETQNIQFGSDMRYAFGWFNPLGILYCAGA
jgi:hypothetical protein